MSYRLRLLALALLLPTALGTASTPRPDGQPHKLEMNPPAAYPGNTVLFRVELNQTTSLDQDVTIASDGAFWSSIPSIVTVPGASSEVYFYATIQLDPSGSNAVQASCNGGSVTCYAMLHNGRQSTH